MRISTSLVAAAVAGGSLSLALQAANIDQESTVPLADATGTPTVTQSPTSESTASPQTDSTASPSPSQSSGSAASKPKPTTSSAPSPATPVVKTVASDPITYKYGVVQIEITATDGKITKVVLLQGDASYGRDAAYSALIDATVQVQGTNYGNVSGATFTTEAFKKAVENAISKL